MRTRRFLAAGCALALAAPAPAQVFDRLVVQTGPQVVQYRIKAPLDETVTEVAVPIFAIVPVSDRFSFDIGTAWAQSKLEAGGARSMVSGFTDTQLRGNYTLGNDFVILTAGANIPTGESTVSLAELPAASRIANDFLSFPISSMGTGTAVTGGVAVARPLGNWSVGFGGSVRVASAFEPIRPDSGPLPRYQPGNEYKLRIGADRPVGAGQLALGFTYSAFGQDDFAGSLYNTGDRYVAQAGFTRPTRRGTISLAAWNLYRGAGQLIGGVATPWDNIANISGSVAMETPRGATLEPSLQVRSWLQRVAATGSDAARTDRSLLGELGLRSRFELGGVNWFPGVAYTIGRLAAGADARAGLQGFKASLGVRVR